MKKFTQLTLKERYQISAYIKVGYTQNDIAKLLDKSQSTISREISRNSKHNKYQAEVA
ncbi:helix-turn-helix domain-containing protein, partial [Poseidonibacter ostreae]